MNKQKNQWPSSSRSIGLFMEENAIKFLQKKGFTLISKNYRHKRCEIDLIMQKLSFIVFIEVKYRRNFSFGYPENFLSINQIERIHTAAENFLEKNNLSSSKIRFDIVAITNNHTNVQIDHFEDAF